MSSVRTRSCLGFLGVVGGFCGGISKCPCSSDTYSTHLSSVAVLRRYYGGGYGVRGLWGSLLTIGASRSAGRVMAESRAKLAAPAICHAAPKERFQAGNYTALAYAFPSHG